MKKIIAICLALMMILGLCACTSSGNAEETQGGAAAASGLQIGYAKINVTPDFSVGLGGYSDAETRRSEGFVEYIYTTCIAATEGDETILVYTIDNCASSKSVADRIRSAVSPATGIAEDKIFVGATHCHSCPSLTQNDAEGARYKQMFVDACVEAATKALEDRAAATISAATHEIPGMNFVRHYEMEDGTHAGSNFGDFSKKIVGHSAEGDPNMVIVKFDRPDDKKDVLLVNWQAHPDRGTEIGRNLIAASFVGPLRDELEKLSGAHVAYFTGASGNQNIDSKIASEAHNLNWKDYGIKMGQLTNEALSQLQPVEGSGIKTTGTMFEVEIDHSWDHMLAQANEVYDLWKSAGKTAGDALGRQYGFTSSYQARAIRSRAAMSKTAQLEVNAFSIGGIGFTTGTYEMFSTHGLYVKENSPFDVTVIISGNSGYIPTPEAYVYRSYEADTGMYASGTGEKLAENYVKMLTEVK